MADRPRCKQCVFWDPIPEFANLGQCRRGPPTPMHVLKASMVKHPGPEGPQTVVRAVFPPTGSNEWCGEFLMRGELPEPPAIT